MKLDYNQILDICMEAAFFRSSVGAVFSEHCCTGSKALVKIC